MVQVKKKINVRQGDTFDTFDDACRFVTQFLLLIFEIFSFQESLESKSRYAVLL